MDCFALIHEAENQEAGYTAFLNEVLGSEIRYRQNKARERRIKEAGFPYKKYLKDFDLNFCQSITKKQLNQQTEFTWIDGIYNLILSSPSGVGKTHLAIALATAILDRLSYRCDRVQLLGKSYRLENQKSFLQKGTEKDEIS